VTVPEPIPAVPIAREYIGMRLNVAVTEVFFVIVTGMVLPEPETSPDQPTKVLPAAGVAVNVTTVPLAYVAALGLLVNVPEPLPAVPTLRVYIGMTSNVAVTEVFFMIVTGMVLAEPETSPDQPANVLPDAGVAVNVTTVPLA